MTFWIICAALTGVVALAIAAPLTRRRSPGDSAAACDLRIYRDQLREVERDLERRLVDPAEAERLRTEIGRKVLAADRALREQPAGAPPGGRAALVLLALLLAGAFLAYDRLGAPGAPDQPIAQRLAQAQARYQARPSQAEAERLAPRPDRPAPDPEYLDLVQKLRAAVARNPDDPRGQELLALHEERLGNLAAAREAQARLVALKAGAAGAEDYARLAGLTVEAAGGLVTREAEAAMRKALELDPAQVQMRYLAGLLQIQNGRADRAFPIWAALLAEAPADPALNALIRPLIGDLAWLAGQPDYQPPDDQQPGPDADALAAARDMAPEDRERMIEGMVQGLEARLARQGGTPQEWARLIAALAVLGQKDHAQEILAEARRQFGPEAAAPIEEAAGKAGLQ
ncbi:MAG: c-type cytochrome biogenesis protein CcmI [Paracoccus sp. (in: a-proteobacteria)]|uniref:c-type cytochrome biogenesis protein CcmI n=1 Tax=Paracoccus sp. TaxID=267 RepID=UPI0039E412AD